MRRQDVLLVALVLLLLVWLGPGNGSDLVGSAIDAVKSPIINGALVGPATQVGEDGIVPDDPADLAAAAGLDIETYSLARALMSEHGNDPDPYLVAAAWAIKNYAAEQGRTITALLTDGKGTAGDGRYGRQSASAGTKYAATDQDPRERHARFAGEVLALELPDPTGGATHFFSPKAQDALNKRDASRWKPAAELLASWTARGGLYAEGAHVVPVSGVDPYRLTLLARGLA
jgi:hypothetical protein